jgi:isocitrate dehydrogenase (NAD+)
MIVDNCSMQLVKNPSQFDVMVAPNLYGTIISHIGAGIIFILFL